MTATMPAEAIDDVLRLLGELADEQARPADARARMAALALAHPAVRIDLVWDEEPYGGVHYDALVRVGGRTISLSATGAAPDELPWPLRGAQRAGDSVLLDVDGERLMIADAIAHLDALDDGPGAGLAQRLVDACLQRREVLRLVAALDEESADAAVAAYRRQLGLSDDAALRQWRRERGLGPEDFRRTALLHIAYGLLRRDGVDGVPLAQWLRSRRREATIRWHWQVGAARPGGDAR